MVLLLQIQWSPNGTLYIYTGTCHIFSSPHEWTPSLAGSRSSFYTRLVPPGKRLDRRGLIRAHSVTSHVHRSHLSGIHHRVVLYMPTGCPRRQDYLRQDQIRRDESNRKSCCSPARTDTKCLVYSNSLFSVRSRSGSCLVSDAAL